MRERSNVFLPGGGEECKSEAAAQRQRGRERRLHLPLCNISTSALLRLISPDPLGRISSQLERASSHLSDGPAVLGAHSSPSRGEEGNRLWAPTRPDTPAQLRLHRGKETRLESLCIKKRIIMHNKKTPAPVYINTALTEYPFPNSPSGSQLQQSSILNIWLPPRPPGGSGLGWGGGGRRSQGREGRRWLCVRGRGLSRKLVGQG